jgi:hypothetical protein
MSLIRSAVIALALFALSASGAQACSCVKRSDEQQFREARLVVVGLVRETRFIPDKRVFGGGYIRAVVDARETLKGNSGRRLTVIDQLPEGGTCSSFLRAGIEFVLFVGERSEVGMCSGTRPLGATVYDRSEKIGELKDLKVRAGL